VEKRQTREKSVLRCYVHGIAIPIAVDDPILMVHHDALGRSGCARGVHNFAEVVLSDIRRPELCRTAPKGILERKITGILLFFSKREKRPQERSLRPDLFYYVLKRVMNQERLSLRMMDDVSRFLSFVIRVNWNQDTANLCQAQPPVKVLRAIGKKETYSVAFLNAQAKKGVGSPIDIFVEFPVGHLLVGEVKEDFVRIFPALHFQEIPEIHNNPPDEMTRPLGLQAMRSRPALLPKYILCIILSGLSVGLGVGPSQKLSTIYIKSLPHDHLRAIRA
jgi:hypothetical protein